MVASKRYIIAPSKKIKIHNSIQKCSNLPSKVFKWSYYIMKNITTHKRKITSFNFMMVLPKSSIIDFRISHSSIIALHSSSLSLNSSFFAFSLSSREIAFKCAHLHLSSKSAFSFFVLSSRISRLRGDISSIHRKNLQSSCYKINTKFQFHC